jgi:hypothetical protein
MPQRPRLPLLKRISLKERSQASPSSSHVVLSGRTKVRPPLFCGHATESATRIAGGGARGLLDTPAGDCHLLRRGVRCARSSEAFGVRVHITGGFSSPLARQLLVATRLSTRLSWPAVLARLCLPWLGCLATGQWQQSNRILAVTEHSGSALAIAGGVGRATKKGNPGHDNPIETSPPPAGW